LHADIREIAFDGAFDAVICMGTTFGFFDDEANRDVLARLHGLSGQEDACCWTSSIAISSFVRSPT